MKIVKKLLIIIITFVLGLLLIFNVYNFISIKLLNKDLPTFGGYAVLEVISGSMEPTIMVGDLIIIDTKVVNYKENDIVTFYDVDNSFVTHRIISINDKEMVTKGDANNTVDEPTKTKKLVGKYVFKINGAGKILTAFKSPFVMFMILIIGLLFCFLVSTDKNGNPIITQEELDSRDFREYRKFMKYKKKLEKKKGE